MRSIALLLLALASPAAANLTFDPTHSDPTNGQGASVKYASGILGTLFLQSDFITLSMEIKNDASTAGTILFSFSITDPDGATVFSQTGNSAPGTTVGKTGATLSSIPVSRFYTKSGPYTLTAKATLGSLSATDTVGFQAKDAQIQLLSETASPLSFQWGSGASKYRLTVSEDTFFTTEKIKFTEETTATVLYCSQTADQCRQNATDSSTNKLVSGKPYYWKVEGIDPVSGKVIATPIGQYRTFQLQAGSTPNSRNVAITGIDASYDEKNKMFDVYVNVANLGGQTEGPIYVRCSLANALYFYSGSQTSATVETLPQNGTARVHFTEGVNLADPSFRPPYLLVASLWENHDDVPSDDTMSVEWKRPEAAGAKAGPCSPNPCYNGGKCSASGTSYSCNCLNGFFGTLCQNYLAAPRAPATGKVEVSSIELQPLPAPGGICEWCENPDAPGAYDPVKITLTNGLSAPTGTIVVTFGAASQIKTLGTLTATSIAAGGSTDFTVSVPFRDPSPNATADYIAAWQVITGPGASGSKTQSLKIPTRKTASAATASGDLAITLANQTRIEGGNVWVKFIAGNNGPSLADGRVHVNDVTGKNLESQWVSEVLEANASLPGEIAVPVSLVGAGGLQAKVCIEAAGSDSKADNDCQPVTLSATGESPTCDDYNPCTVDFFDSGVCRHPFVADGTSCTMTTPSGDIAGQCVTGTCAAVAGAAAAATADTPDLQVTLTNPRVRSWLGNRFDLAAAVNVQNNGGAQAKHFKLHYTITTAKGSDAADVDFAPHTVDSKGSRSWGNQNIFFPLARDPIKNSDTVTATVILLDDNGQPAKDQGPSNHTFTLKLGVPAAAAASALCGNKVVDPGETCDLGKDVPGCQKCQVQTGWTCKGDTCTQSTVGALVTKPATCSADADCAPKTGSTVACVNHACVATANQGATSASGSGKITWECAGLRKDQDDNGAWDLVLHYQNPGTASEDRTAGVTWPDGYGQTTLFKIKANGPTQLLVPHTISRSTPGKIKVQVTDKNKKVETKTVDWAIKDGQTVPVDCGTPTPPNELTIDCLGVQPAKSGAKDAYEAVGTFTYKRSDPNTFTPVLTARGVLPPGIAFKTFKPSRIDLPLPGPIPFSIPFSFPGNLPKGNESTTGSFSLVMAGSYLDKDKAYHTLRRSIDVTYTGKTLTPVACPGASGAAAAGAITPGVATKLSFTTQPSGAQPGTAFTQQPVVAALDAAGALAKTFTGTAMLTLKQGTGAAGAVLTQTPVAFSQGLATFTGAKIDLAGTAYVLKVTAGTLASAESAAFSVGTAAASASPHNLVVSNFGVNAAGPDANDASTGPLTVHLTITNLGTVLEKGAVITFTVDNNTVPSFTMTLPDLDVGAIKNWSFHLPYREGTKLDVSVKPS